MPPPTLRTKDSLLSETDRLCTSIIDPRNPDPYGGTGYLSTILRAIRMQDASPNGVDGRTSLEPRYEYATSAWREAVVRDATAGLVSRHLISTHTWYFGSRGGVLT